MTWPAFMPLCCSKIGATVSSRRSSWCLPPQRIKKGPRLKSPRDEHKFNELVNENRGRILRVCRAYAWNSADQDDLYQEIVLQVWRGLPGLKDRQFADTWLYRVALNTAMSFVRKRASRTGRVIHFDQADLERTIESRQAKEKTRTIASPIFTRPSTNLTHSKKR